MILNDSENVSISFSWASCILRYIDWKNQAVVIYYATALLSFSFSCSGTQAQPIPKVPSLLFYGSWYATSRFHREITFTGVWRSESIRFIKSVDSNMRLSRPSCEVWLEGSSRSFCVSFITISSSILHWLSRHTTTQSSFFVNGSQIFV